MNLAGMSLNAKKMFIEKDDISCVPPGYFWCEWFDGCQYSVSYKWNEGFWFPISSYKAHRDEQNLYKFRKWTRSSWVASLPKKLEELKDVQIINVEFVNSKIIEVHLRDTPDPQYEELIPIWKSDTQLVDIYKQLGYSYLENHDDADGFLDNPRIGFMVK
jgi:hypothetical protein